ncbi:uncharacterized protein LOC144275853 isoform X1 [Eretmochelys imbricata]
MVVLESNAINMMIDFTKINSRGMLMDLLRGTSFPLATSIQQTELCCPSVQFWLMLGYKSLSEDNTIITPSARGMLERTLKAAIHSLYIEALKRKPDQGNAFELTSKWDASNHFLARGGFADWRYIHRARLNCVPFNGAIRHGNRDKRCRKCGYSNETLPHVLCSCKPHSRAWQLRHNAIQNRLVKAIAPCLGAVAVNCAIPGTDSLLRPDVVITDEAQKKIILIDITVPFENRTLAFREA